MPTADEIADAIATSATGPKAATGDAGSITQHDLQAQIEAAKFLEQRAAAKGSKQILRFGKFVPPGTA